MNIECLVKAKDIVGESPLWHPEHECVYWTDLNGFKIHRYREKSNELQSWRFDAPVSALSLTTDAEWLLAAVGARLMLWSPAGDRRIPFVQPERDWPRNRLNDGATDPNGVFWIGSMRNNVGQDGSDLQVEGFTGSLYRVAADGEVSVEDEGFGITNTLVWSPDHATFYCGCSIRNVIYAYDYNAASSLLSNRRVFVENLSQGVPDGSAMDDEGCLWNCRFAGGCILRISPAGKVVQEIRMPVSNVTNCSFGRSDLRTLYVSTASLHAGQNEELAGGLFTMRTDVRGVGPARFRLSAQTISLLAGI
jgi:sugar lactone lactonase YvrE